MFCHSCGKEVAEDQMFCQHCGARLREETAAGAEHALPGPASRERTAWEDRDRLGLLNGLIKTLNEVLFRPSDFFKKMPVTGGLIDPLLFALIVGMVGLMFSYLWQMVTKGAMQDMMSGIPGAGGQDMLGGVGIAFLAFFSPFMLIAGLFIAAGILHVCLMLVKGAHAGFEASFRVAAYGYGANLFLVVPFCGYPLMLVWSIVLFIIGLKEAHGTTGGRAAFAVFLPVIACACLFMLAMSLFLGAAAASLGTLLQMPK